MHRCVLPLVDRMGSIGIGHHGEGLVVEDQFIDQSLEALVVNIIISRAVHVTRSPFKVLGKVEG